MALVREPIALYDGFADAEVSSSWCLDAGLAYQYHHPLLLEEALLLGSYSGEFTSVLTEPADEALVHDRFSSSVLTVEVPACRQCQEEVHSDAMDQNYCPVATTGMPTVVPCQSEFGTANWFGFRGGNSMDAGGEARFGLLYPSTSSVGGAGAEAVAGKAAHKRPFSGAPAELEASPKKQCGGDRKTKVNKAPTSPPKDSQNLAAKNRREKISERLKILQELVPNGTKVDLVTMLEKAISYVKFLQLQVQVLAADEFWPTQDGKAPEISQVKDALDAILSSSQWTPSS